MALFLNGDRGYQGNPDLHRMLLASALQQQGVPPPVSLGSQKVTSEPVQVRPDNVPAGPNPGMQGAQMQAPNQDGPTLPDESRLQLSNAIASLGRNDLVAPPRPTPPDQQPVFADGSQPLADYSKTPAPASLTANLPSIKHRNSIDWQRIAGIVGDALLGAAGRPGIYGPMMERRRQMEAEQQFELSKLSLQQHAPREVGHSLVQLGDDGKYQTLYTAPEPFEVYAQAQGLQPGTPEYANAVKNYRLGAWSDDAVAAKTDLMGQRYGYMGQLQDDRLATSRRNTDVRVNASVGNNMRSTSATLHGQNLSHQDRVRGQNLHAATTQRGQNLTDARVRGSASYQGRGGHGAPAIAYGPNGHQIVVKNGRWVDAQTGQPVQ